MSVTSGSGVRALGILLGLAVPALAHGQMYDPFFQHVEKEHRIFYEGMPDESIDPFSGNLRVVHTDLVLPGKAGHDLRIVRSYSSKMWVRTDNRTLTSFLAESPHSVLGYGWSFHMGHLINPNASGFALECASDYPLLELPDGSARVFYRVSPSNANVYASRDYWRMERNCSFLGGNLKGTCVWSNTGVRYEFANSFYNSYYYGDSTLTWPLTAMVDPHGNRISVAYVQDRSGAISSITDTYGRSITFRYSSGGDAKRLTSMTVGDNVYEYRYTAYATIVGGSLAPRRFLTEVVPPSGPSWKYAYAIDADVTANQYALSTLTYPSGATVSYTYATAKFYSGMNPPVPFAVVSAKKVTDRGGGDLGTWTYAYSAPASGMNTTTITRPDGKADVFTMYGFGAASKGSIWKVGLTAKISRANGAEVEALGWDPRSGSPVANALYQAPAYATCDALNLPIDKQVYAPALASRSVTRDGATFQTTYTSWDAYGQPLAQSETGQQARTTAWTYSSHPTDATGATLNLVRDRPATQHVCVGTDCFDNAWSYGGPDFSRDSETLSGVTTKLGYHLTEAEGRGTLESVTNALGESLTLSGYGANSGWGTPTKLDFNGAYTVRRTGSWEGWITSETNGRGYTTRWAYDGIGRVKTLTPPTGYATSYTYAADGSSVTLKRGSYVETRALDGLGRVTSTTNSESVLTRHRYDTMGRVWFESDPYDTATGEVGERRVFDGLGRVTTLTRGYRPAKGTCDATGACTLTSAYASNCVTTTVQRAAGDSPATVRCSASFGDPDERRLTDVTDPSKRSWHYTYSAHGELGAVAAPLTKGNRSYAHDARQYLVGEASGEQGATTYTRNAIGQMTVRKDARGVLARFGHDDPLSRLRSITYDGQTADDVARSYDEANNVKEISSKNGGTIALSYDEQNRLLSRAWTFGGKTYSTTYTYDTAGCLRSVKYPTGTSLALTCDTMNRVKTISLGGSSIVSSVSYHPSGQPRSVTYGNGKSTAWTYDDRGRAKTVTSAGVVELSYAYDGADNVTAFSNGAVTGSARTMTYDEQDRLETAIAKNLWGTAVYQYDELGNRTLASVGSSTTSYAYDASNRLSAATGAAPSTLKYDAVGGLLTGYGQTLTWDVAGRLATSSDGAVYRYDGDGARVEKVEAAQTTLYHHDLGGRVLAETLASGAALREYVYLGDKLVAVSGCVSGSAAGCTAERQWYHTDTLGSVLARTNASGTVVARLDYAPWGEQWTVPAAQGDRQYNGRVYDPGTGFHDYGARMYWPLPGRFISADSVQGDIANPASLNRYSYVLNNPYKYVDPTGHQEADPEERVGEGASGDVGGTLRSARQAQAMEKIEQAGGQVATIGPPGPPSEEAVSQIERLASDVTRREALSQAQDHAQVPRVSKGGEPIPFDTLRPDSRGANAAELQRRGATNRGRQSAAPGGPRVEDHPDGHPELTGPGQPPHHEGPHVHGVDRAGNEVVIPYRGPGPQ